MGEDLYYRLVSDEIAVTRSVHGSIEPWDDAWLVVVEMRACTDVESLLAPGVYRAVQSREVSDG